MTLKTWSFAKRKNSTKQPAVASTDYTVYMKENTSIENPVFILGTGIDSNINYCQWSGNYYFIDDIELLSKDQVALHCSLDPLATHKTAIGNYTAFIERSATVNDPYLIDSAVSSTQNVIYESMTSNTEIFPYDDNGCFIVRTVSPGVSSTGIVSWIMNTSDLNTMLDFLTTDSNFSDVISDSIVKTFFNPFQYILSVKWFPIAKADIAGTTENMRLGWWDVGDFKMLTSQLYYNNAVVSKPTGYYSGDFRAYTNNYTRLIADICSIGVVELDPLLLDGVMKVKTCIDWITGEIRVTFGKEGTQGGLSVMIDEYSSFSGVLGIDVPVGQVNGMTSQVLSAAPGMDYVTAAASGLVAGVSDVIKGISNAIHPTSSVLGASGNMAAIKSNPRLLLFLRSYGSGEFPNAVYGRPCCKNRKINTLSGFVKCNAASIELNAPLTEIEKVNTYLNEGFYYE